MPFMPATFDRCSCGWAFGENLSGGCRKCNEANVQLGGRKGRKCGTDVVFKKTLTAVAGAAPDLDDRGQEKLEVHPKQRLPVKQRGQGIKDAHKDSNENESAAKLAEKAAELTEQATKVIPKHNADQLLFANGFSRTVHLEKKHRNANVDCPDWMIIHSPRDGHCLWHCLLSILHERYPNSVIQNQNQLRDAVVSFYESHGNVLHVGDLAFMCEHPHAIRTARDKSGMCLHYGGLPEAVGFALKFKISLEVYAPETFLGPFNIPAGGAPEAIIQTLGWHGVCRRRGMDHWQRMMCTAFPVSGDAARFVKGESCIVCVEGNDVEAKVMVGKGIATPEGPLVYCWTCETHYGQPLGNFPAAKVRKVERVVIASQDEGVDTSSATATAAVFSSLAAAQRVVAVPAAPTQPPELPVDLQFFSPPVSFDTSTTMSLVAPQDTAQVAPVLSPSAPPSLLCSSEAKAPAGAPSAPDFLAGALGSARALFTCTCINKPLSRSGSAGFHG